MAYSSKDYCAISFASPNHINFRQDDLKSRSQQCLNTREIHFRLSDKYLKILDPYLE